MREISYEPRNVREILVELKDSSELAADLAYSAVRYDDPALADEVLELESRVDYLQYHVRIALMLAAKRADEAERLVGLFQVAASAIRITEAAGDIARIVVDDGGVPTAFEHAFPEADERLVRATIGDDSALAGARLRELELDLETGVRLIAIRRADAWSFSPDGDNRLEAGDVVVGRGPRDGIETVYRRATGEPFPEPSEPPESTATLERAAETVIDLKDMAELAVGLGYGAARFDNDALAREVLSLERQSNELQAALESWVIEAGGAGAAHSADELRGLLRLAVASEVICDAAVDVAEVVLREVELPPVFGTALEESEEVVDVVTIGSDSPLEGRSVDDLESEEGAGIVVLGVDGDAGWTIDPDPDRACSAGETLLVRGPPLGVEALRERATGERDELG